jgi:poly-gamma-glutamate synthesis protein (capsule biosynthesis protein)
MHPRYLRALKGAGIGIVNIANNHVFDYGPEGLFDTISYLDSAGIHHVGAGRNREEAHRPVVLVIRGVRIGFLGYYGGGEAPGAGRRNPGVARRKEEEVVSDIRDLRDRRGVGYVVVNLHWGTENATVPSREQRALAHTLIDAGADAVVGHHPHVLQGIERYGRGVIAYSLGNFVFGGNRRDTYDTGMLEIRLSAGGAEYTFVPVRIDHWRAGILSGRDSLRSIASMRKLSSGFPKTIFTN